MSYPIGYSRQRVSLDELDSRFGPAMHPEFRRRLRAWLHSRGGKIGVGSAWRPTPSNASAASRAGHSFHQSQRFHGGIEACTAVDLVVATSSGVHRAPNWSEVPKQGSGHPDIARYGLHANVSGEPWHLQPIELDGWQTWVNRGRPDLHHHAAVVAPVPGTVVGSRPDIWHGHYGLYPLDRHKHPRWIGHLDPHVGYLQAVLRQKCGHHIAIDDYFGPQTRARVNDLQSYFQLIGKRGVAPGKVHARTWDLVDLLAGS